MKRTCLLALGLLLALCGACGDDSSDDDDGDTGDGGTPGDGDGTIGDGDGDSTGGDGDSPGGPTIPELGEMLGAAFCAEAEACLADLAEPGAAAQLVGFAAETFGGLDQIVSNAGFADPTRFGEVSRGELDRSLATMTGAFFDLATAALPHLRKSRRGRVVAISSFVAHAFPADYLFPVTAAAKGGLEALARTLARQLAADGGPVNCVAPGCTRTDKQGHSSLGGDAWQRAAELTPMGRIADPDDIAALVAFLLGPEARHITGQVIHVDGGLGLG